MEYITCNTISGVNNIMNTINLKALASLASELNIHVGLLELKLNQSGIKIQKDIPCGFKSNRRRNILELY